MTFWPRSTTAATSACRKLAAFLFLSFVLRPLSSLPAAGEAPAAPGAAVLPAPPPAPPPAAAEPAADDLRAALAALAAADPADRAIRAALRDDHPERRGAAAAALTRAGPRGPVAGPARTRRPRPGRPPAGRRRLGPGRRTGGDSGADRPARRVVRGRRGTGRGPAQIGRAHV